MTIALDLVTSAVGTLGSLTYSHEVRDDPAGRFLVVAVQINSGDVTGVTYNGIAMIQQATENQGNYSTWLFTLEDPDLGSNDVVVSTDSAGELASGALTFHGVDTDTPIVPGSINDANGSGGSITVTSSGRRVGQVVIDAVVAQATLIIVGVGQTQRYLSTFVVNERGGVSTEPGVLGDVVMSWFDVDLLAWAIVTMALNPGPKTVEGVGAQFGPQVFVRRPAGVAY